MLQLKLLASLRRQLLISESLAIVEQIKTLRVNEKPLLYHSPLLFHGTSLRNAEKIIADGFIRPGQTEKSVCFSEIDVPEIERLKMKRMEIAFAFLRKDLRTLHPDSFGEDISFKNHKLKNLYVQALHETSQLSPGSAARQFLEQLKYYVPRQEPLIELKEYRVLEQVDIKNTLWILAKDADFSQNPKYQQVRKLFSQKFGSVHYSYWNQNHMQALIEEPQYVTFRLEEGQIIDFKSTGAYYANRKSNEYPLYRTAHLISTEQSVAFQSEYDSLRHRKHGTSGKMTAYFPDQVRVRLPAVPVSLHLWPLSHYQVGLTLYHLLKRYGTVDQQNLLKETLIDYSATKQPWREN